MRVCVNLSKVSLYISIPGACIAVMADSPFISFFQTFSVPQPSGVIKPNAKNQNIICHDNGIKQ